MSVKLLGDRVLIQSIEQEEVKKGGIIIPDTAKEKSEEGKIIAVGTGKREEGKLIPFEVKKGDRVLFNNSYGAKQLKLDGKEYLIVSTDDIIGIIE